MLWMSSEVVGFISVEDKKTINNVLQVALIERNTIATAFCVLFFVFSIDRMSCDDDVVRTECLRNVTLLLILKEKFMSKYLASLSLNRSRSIGTEPSLDVSVLWSLMSLMVPEDIGGYEAQLRFHDVFDLDAEQSSHYEFTTWVTANQTAMNRMFGVFMTNALQLLPANDVSVSNVISNAQLTRVGKHRAYDYTTFSATRNENHMRISSQVLFNMKQWMLYGVASTSIGALNWRKLWCSLQVINYDALKLVNTYIHHKKDTQTSTLDQ